MRRIGGSFSAFRRIGPLLLPWWYTTGVLKSPSTAAFTITLTGTTFDEARNGNSIGVAISPALGGGETVSYQWTDNDTPIGGATASTFTVNIGTNFTDGQTLRCEVTIDGETFTSNGAPVRYDPGAFAALTNQSFTDDTGNQTYVFTAATGTGLTWTYALTSPPAGVSIVSATRTITHDTDAMAVQSGTVITVTATDQYGREATGSPRTYNLTISEVDTTAPTAASVVAGTQQSDGSLTIAVTTLSEDSTIGIVWTSSDQSGASNSAVKTAAQGGTALTDQLSVDTQAATVGGGPYTVTDGLPSGQDGTVYYQLVFWDASDNISSVFSGSVTLDTTAPTVSTLSPADNATDVAVDANLVMTFSEGMKRQGTVTLKNVGGATIETFDLSTDGTWSTTTETDDTWTGNPASDFTNSATLAVQWSGLEDTKGNALANNATDTTWNFTVVAAGSGITLVGSAWTTAEVPSGAGTTNVSFPATAAENDVAVIIRACDTTLNSTGTTGATNIYVTTGDTPGYRAEYIVLGATPGTSVEVAQTSSEQAVIVGLLRGVDTTNVLDQTPPSSVFGTSDSVTPAAITTVTNGAWVIVAAFLDDDVGVSVNAYPSGYTNTTSYCTPTPASGGGATAAVATKEVATAGTETPGSFQFSSTDQIVGRTFAIRPA